MKRTMHRLAALAAVGTIALAGCASGGSSSEDVRSPERSSSAEGDEGGGSTSSATQQQEETSQDRSDSGADSDSDSGSDSGSDTNSDPAGTHIARTAGLAVTVEDIEQASTKVRSAASRVGGYVSSEETHLEDEDTASGASVSRAELVVTVPVEELDSTMASLAKVGTVTERTSDATDLSKQYTDTEARVRSMKKSITRLRTLIDETEDLEQIVDLEGELAKREADLESKVSQQKSLEKRTTTSPITVSLTTPGTASEEPAEETGFLAGLGHGWEGFTSAMTMTLTVLGALTPFALTALVVLGPIGWWLRRRVRRGSTPTEVSAS